MPVIDRLPIPVTGGQIPPRTPRTSPEVNPVDNGAVIVPPVSLPQMRRQQRSQQLPLFVPQIMTIQTFIDIHSNGLPNPKIKIYGTRPRCLLDSVAVLLRELGAFGNPELALPFSATDAFGVDAKEGFGALSGPGDDLGGWASSTYLRATEGLRTR